MFKEKFIRLCANKGVAPSFVAKQVGISSAAFSQWTDETVPRKTTLLKIADYFGVSVDYLLGKAEKEKTCILDKISTLLKEQHVSQKKLCCNLGLSQQAFTNWKNGNNDSYKKYLPQIAEFLGVSVDYLLGKEEKNAPGKDNLTEGENEWLDFFREIPEESRSLALEVFKTFKMIPEDRQAEALELLQVALRMQKKS